MTIDAQVRASRHLLEKQLCAKGRLRTNCAASLNRPDPHACNLRPGPDEEFFAPIKSSLASPAPLKACSIADTSRQSQVKGVSFLRWRKGELSGFFRTEWSGKTDYPQNARRLLFYPTGGSPPFSATRPGSETMDIAGNLPWLLGQKNQLCGTSRSRITKLNAKFYGIDSARFSAP